ncbi:MAG: ATP-binding protein [Pseudomonadota bacterium]
MASNRKLLDKARSPARAALDKTLEDLRGRPAVLKENSPELRSILGNRLDLFRAVLVEVYSPDKKLLAAAGAPDFKLPPGSLIAEDLNLEIDPPASSERTVSAGREADLFRITRPLVNNGELLGFVSLGVKIPGAIRRNVEIISEGLEGHRQFQSLGDPIRVSHYIALTIVALLSIFVSTWIASHLAKSITGPIIELAEGTDRIAKGDYNFTIQVESNNQEMATLVASFNSMTREIQAGKLQLEQKNLALTDSMTELDQRRRYMETILNNVSSGVIALDAKGQATIINKAAGLIMKLEPSPALGRALSELLEEESSRVLDDLIRLAKLSPRRWAERQVKIGRGGDALSIHVQVSHLLDEWGQDLGLVIVFHDLTELEKAQRMAAWREVARRIAHEIKNPLTPIQLSTQRLRRRCGRSISGEDGQVFDECTLMIIRQVEELKHLVEEFSNFARMPEVSPAPGNLAQIVEETLVLYQESHKGTVFEFHPDQTLPVFDLDREQMKRALINLLDNAVAAVGTKGRIEISLVFDTLLKMARLTVADDGPGISPQDKRRLFEPYFSTKKTGTGLGLAIVRSIVADHDGFVRVQDNFPRGTRFIIELPVRTRRKDQ